MAKHGINYMVRHLRVGEIAPVYPFSQLPFVGKVLAITKNKYGRISYTFKERQYDVLAEELIPADDQQKIKLDYHKWANSR